MKFILYLDFQFIVIIVRGKTIIILIIIRNYNIYVIYVSIYLTWMLFIWHECYLFDMNAIYLTWMLFIWHECCFFCAGPWIQWWIMTRIRTRCSAVRSRIWRMIRTSRRFGSGCRRLRALPQTKGQRSESWQTELSCDRNCHVTGTVTHRN